MKIGFIGLGNVGAKLAGSLMRAGFDLTVRDLDRSLAQPFLDKGARWAESPADMAADVEALITCLPSPAAVRTVMEGEGGALAQFAPGKVWMEMSTTDHHEVRALGALVEERGGHAVDCPVSGGCHRAATGNISILAGGRREAFELVLPLLKAMGRRILHTGELGSASVLKVMTNYLASVNLVSVAEALTTAKLANLDLATTYEAIRISSGTSFVHETEGQVILNGSRDINFTMDLVVKDVSLFQQLAEEQGAPLELSPLIVRIFKDGMQRYGGREFSPNIIRRLEDATGADVTAPGFPAEITDDEPGEPGYEVKIRRQSPAQD